MQTVTAESWTHLQELLFEGSWNESINRHRAPFAYRGSSNADFELNTSLMRLGGPYQDLEKHLLRNFRKYAHNIEENTANSIWNWLTIAQHHGLPTRLLDWSYSPLVALHFATANLEAFEQDGAVWKVNYQDCVAQLPRKLRMALDEVGGNVFTVDILADTVTSLEEFDLMSREDFFIFLEPQSLDARIVNQFALFSIASNATLSLDTLLAQTRVSTHKIVIPKEIKWEVRDRLDQSNITERVLFPGLDGLSAWLKRHYAPVVPSTGVATPDNTLPFPNPKTP
ncbi:MAG: FRG domain-containing protein [Pseudomonadota bacterium]